MHLDRYVTHGVVLLVAALTSGYTFSAHLAPRAGALDASAAGPLTVGGDAWYGRDTSIIKPVYIPTAPLPNRAPLIYTVAAGDTLESIAKDLKIPFREITWSNPGLRLPLKAAEHVPGTVGLVRRRPDVLHLQWLAAPELDRFFLRPRVPTVFTAHSMAGVSIEWMST